MRGCEVTALRAEGYRGLIDRGELDPHLQNFIEIAAQVEAAPEYHHMLAWSSQGEEPIGTISLHLPSGLDHLHSEKLQSLEPFRSGHDAEILKLFMREPGRHPFLTSALLFYAIDLAFTQGSKHLFANCSDHQLPIYTKVGFERLVSAPISFGTTACVVHFIRLDLDMLCHSPLFIRFRGRMERFQEKSLISTLK
jgi:hypothetical protein